MLDKWWNYVPYLHICMALHGASREILAYGQASEMLQYQQHPQRPISGAVAHANSKGHKFE